MIKKCRHCVGTRGRVVGGDGLGNADVCMGNRDTRVVKVNGMSTEFRGVSFVSFVDVCIVLEWGICRCKKHQPRGGAHESAAARIDSCCPPVPNDRLHSTTLASFGQTITVNAIVAILFKTPTSVNVVAVITDRVRQPL